MMKEHPFSFLKSDAARRPRRIHDQGAWRLYGTIGSVPRDAVAFVDGPYGAFTIDRHPAPGYVFVAGGIGIAPIMSMLRSLADRGDQRPLLLFYAYRRWERMTFREAIEDVQSRLTNETTIVTLATDAREVHAFAMLPARVPMLFTTALPMKTRSARRIDHVRPQSFAGHAESCRVA